MQQITSSFDELMTKVRHQLITVVDNIHAAKGEFNFDKEREAIFTEKPGAPHCYFTNTKSVHWSVTIP